MSETGSAGKAPWVASAFALALAALYLPGHMAETTFTAPILGNSLQLVPLGWALLFAAGSTGLGASFLRLTGQRSSSLSMGLFLSSALGAGFMSCLVVLILSAGFSGATAMMALTALPALGLLVSSRKKSVETASAFMALLRRHPVLVFSAAAFALVNLAGSLAPVITYDDQVYHLPLARAYASRGAVIPDGSIPQAYKPFLGIAPYVWAHLVSPPRGETDPAIISQAIHAIFGLITALGCYAGAGWLLSRFFGGKAKSWVPVLAALLFLSTPQTAILSASAYVDLFESALELAAVLSLAMGLTILADGDPSPARHFQNAGLAGGLAAGVKYTMLYTGVAAGVAIILLCFAHRGAYSGQGQRETIAPRGAALRGMAIFAVVSAVIVAPFFAWAWYFTGNPVYPHFSGIFPGNLTDEAAAGLKRKVESPGFEFFKGRFGPERTLFWVLTLPVTPFTDSYIHNKAKSLRHFDGLLSPQVLMGLGFLMIPTLLAKGVAKFDSHGGSLAFLALFSVLRFSIWACGSLQARFLFPLVPVLAIFSALGLAAAFEGARKVALPALVAVGAVILFNFVFCVARHCDKGVFNYLTGAIDRESYLSARLPFYESFRFINKEVPPGARVIPLYEPRIYYLERPVKWCAETAIWPVNLFYGSDSAAEVAGRFRNLGVEYVFLPIHGVKFLQEILLGAGNPGVEGYTHRLEEFFGQWVECLRSDRFGFVLKIRKAPLAGE